jgi:tetratricopeptide (TPR) repeat protein
LLKGELAVIKCELADVATDSETKRSMLEAAILERENAIKLLVKDVSYHPQKNMASFALLGNAQYLAGGWLMRLYRLTRDKEHLGKAVEAFTEAVESYQKANLTSRVAECYWKIAQVRDELDDHLMAAENFCLASDTFKSVARKIPQLKSFYEDHAVYMQAWSEIEKARHHHERQEYGLAKEHFEKAAELHKPLKRWSYLEPNYSAWARVEDAEDLSRKEQCEEAIQAFGKATKLFEESKKSIQEGLAKVEGAEEKQMATQILNATGPRREYCKARVAIEEGKILDKKGDHSASSEKYSSAATLLQKMSQMAESEQEKKELGLILTLSQAWARMTQAEAEGSPDLYVEASKLFEEAKEFSPNEQTKMLTLGHSRFCRALEAGTKFADTRDTTMYTAAVHHLESAATYYVKADFPKASEYAKATGLLFDAYAQMDNAKEERDPEKKARLYTMAEKVLQTCAGAYMKAEHPEKGSQVQRLLEKVKEEQELATSLTEVLHAPTIVSTSAAFTTPAPTKEEAVGSERFEHADVQANIITRQKELKVGEDLELEIELVNAGKGPALLIKVTEVIPEGFDLSQKPEAYRVEDSYLNMKGKRLDPLKTEDVKLVLKPKVQGVFPLKPKILYLDENGKYKTHEPEPVTITVKELGIKGWLKGEK